MEKTLQTQYNLIKEGKGDKAYFLKSAYRLFPDMLSQVNSFEDTTRILKNRGVISEGIGGLVTTGKKQDWHAIFNENISALKEEKEKEPSKEVLDNQKHNFDYKDEKNYDNLFGQEFLDGYYTEMKDPKNADKDVEELRAIVAKNLAKDNQYYVKNGQFGVKDLGYTTEAPGLGEPKPAKGKHAPSGYGDIPKYTELKESVLRLAIQDLIKEELNKESIKEEGEKAKKDAMKKRIDREKIMRKKKIKALETLTELEEGEDNDNAKKIKELQSEIKQLEGMAAKLDGKKKVKEGTKTFVAASGNDEEQAVQQDPTVKDKQGAVKALKNAKPGDSVVVATK